MATKNGGSHKAGRDAGSGQFIPVKQAQRDKEGAVVERVPNRTPAPPPPKKR